MTIEVFRLSSHAHPVEVTVHAVHNGFEVLVWVRGEPKRRTASYEIDFHTPEWHLKSTIGAALSMARWNARNTLDLIETELDGRAA